MSNKLCPPDGGPCLIIVPTTLLTQWQAEILKHIRNCRIITQKTHVKQKPRNENELEDDNEKISLNVFVYDSFHKYSSELDARNLARYDVILMSFQALRLGYHESKTDYNGIRARFSVYPLIPPSFLCINYRLVVIDESQNIEKSMSSNSSSIILQMAQSIRSSRRVSVSGTPFGGSRLSDVFCLLQFLGQAPDLSGDYRNWKLAIQNPSVPIPESVRLHWLRQFFNNLILRRTKESVVEQIGLRPSRVEIKTLTFSDFEVRKIILIIFVIIIMITRIIIITSCSNSKNILKRKNYNNIIISIIVVVPINFCAK